MWFESRRNNERRNRRGKPARRAGSSADVFTFSAQARQRAAKGFLTTVCFAEATPSMGRLHPLRKKVRARGHPGEHHESESSRLVAEPARPR